MAGSLHSAPASLVADQALGHQTVLEVEEGSNHWTPEKLRNIQPQFVQSCNPAVFQQLLDDLLHIRVLNDAEVEHIKERFPEHSNKCRTLINMVTKKGDYSCNVLLQAIIKYDPELSRNLGITAELPLPTQELNRNNTNPIQPASVEPPQQKDEQSSQQASVEPPQRKDEQSSQREINGITLCTEAEYQEITAKEKDIYPIREKCKRKRLALIICNIKFDEDVKERKGANFDLEGMNKLLEGLGYNVQWKINLTAEEMRTSMKTFAAKNDHKDSDSTFLVFMSHGERDIIYGTDVKKENVDGQERVTGGLRVDDIFNTFNNKNCPGLRDKPKMIIIQACRGNDESEVWVTDSAQQPPNIEQEDLEDDAMYRILKERDFICFYSTTPDTVSFRDPKSGSLFIQSLIKIMKQDAHNSSIEDIFQKVQLSFKHGSQMPTQDRKTLLKKFFLFPGY